MLLDQINNRDMNILKETNDARFVSYLDWANVRNDMALGMYKDVLCSIWKGKYLIAVKDESQIDNWLKNVA